MNLMCVFGTARIYTQGYLKCQRTINILTTTENAITYQNTLCWSLQTDFA